MLRFSFTTATVIRWAPIISSVPPERMSRVRFDRLTDPEPIPRATEYASTIESDVPIVVQYPARVSEETSEVFAGNYSNEWARK